MTDARRRAITGALLLGTFLSSLEVTVVGAAMPAVVGSLGGAGWYAWTYTAYLLAQTVTTPAYGALADRLGRRPAYLLAVGVFLAGSALCAVAPDMGTLVAGRAVQGVGAGGILPVTQTIFGDIWPVRQRTRIQGVFSLVWGVSSLVGPLLGGLITEAVGWRGVFWLNLLPGAAAAAAVGALVPAGVVGGGRRVTGGLRELLRSPTQQAVLGAGFLLGGALYGYIGYLPLQVTAVEGGTAVEAGLLLLPLSVAWSAAAFTGGRLVGRFGFRTVVRLGVVLATAGAALGALDPTAWPGLVVFGLGMGFTIASFAVAGQEDAPPDLRGTATAWAIFSRAIGSAVLVQAFAWLAGVRPGVTDLAHVPDLAEGVARVFVGIAACAGLAAAVVYARFPPSGGAPVEVERR